MTSIPASMPSVFTTASGSGHRACHHSLSGITLAGNRRSGSTATLLFPAERALHFFVLFLCDLASRVAPVENVASRFSVVTSMPMSASPPSRSTKEKGEEKHQANEEEDGRKDPHPAEEMRSPVVRVHGILSSEIEGAARLETPSSTARLSRSCAPGTSRYRLARSSGRLAPSA